MQATFCPLGSIPSRDQVTGAVAFVCGLSERPTEMGLRTIIGLSKQFGTEPAYRPCTWGMWVVPASVSFRVAYTPKDSGSGRC